MTQDEQPPPKRRGGRPATGRDPVRSVRIGALWDRCIELATSRGESMTTLVERALAAEEKRLRRAIERSGSQFSALEEPTTNSTAGLFNGIGSDGAAYPVFQKNDGEP